METNRWDGFSDSEIELMAEADDGEFGKSDLGLEMEKELDRRRAERTAPTYQGPGVYTAPDGSMLSVVGKITIDHAPMLLIGRSLDDPGLWSLPADRIEGRDENGQRRFTYAPWGGS